MSATASTKDCCIRSVNISRMHQRKMSSVCAKKAYRGRRGVAPLILTSAVDGGEKLPHAPAALSVGNNAFTH